MSDTIFAIFVSLPNFEVKLRSSTGVSFVQSEALNELVSSNLHPTLDMHEWHEIIKTSAFNFPLYFDCTHKLPIIYQSSLFAF